MPGLRVYLDENVDRRVATGLRRRGFIVYTTAEHGRPGANDHEQMARATSLRAALVTHDPDLILLATDAVSAGTGHHGVIFVRMARLPLGEVVRRLASLIATLGTDDLVDQVRFL